MSSEVDKVTFRYLRSNFFRVVHMDGVYGGLTPNGDIFASIFSQRHPHPDTTTQRLTEHVPNEEIGRDVFPGLERELEVGLVMRPDIAESLIVWLQDKVKQYKEVTNQLEQMKLK